MMRFWVGAFAVVTLFAAGCGKDDGRIAVSGTVTLKGEPLKDGSIRFEPKENQGTENGAPIANGQFTLDRNDGLKPGKYLVRITSGDGVTRIGSEEDAAGPGGNTNIVSEDLIPLEWGQQSTQVVEVKAGQPNEFKFDIPNARETKKKKGR